MTSHSAPTSLPLCLYTLRRLSSAWCCGICVFLEPCRTLNSCCPAPRRHICHFVICHSGVPTAGWPLCVCVGACVCDLLDTAQLQPSFWPHYFTLHPSLLLPAPHNLCLLRFPSSLFNRPPPGRCPPLHPYLSCLLRSSLHRGTYGSLLKRLSCSQ